MLELFTLGTGFGDARGEFREKPVVSKHVVGATLQVVDEDDIDLDVDAPIVGHATFFNGQKRSLAARTVKALDHTRT